MQKGDEVFFYHSVESKSIVGLARVTKTFFPDPTAPGEDWAAVELTAVVALAQPVTLAQVKTDAKLQNIALVRQSRLSVMPLRPAEFAQIKQLGGI
jgi:predicted RNA-binding protein with PUA-like domain